MDCFESSVDRFECTEDPQHLCFLEAKAECGTIDAKQIADIETSDKRNKDFLSVNAEQHAVETFLENLAAMVSHGLRRICKDFGTCVLCHDESVLVVSVGDSKSLFAQAIEEPFLGVAVVVKSLVVINMVTREVGEHGTSELQSGNTLLCNTVAADFHESVPASGFHHLCEQGIECKRIGRSVSRRIGSTVHIIDNRRDQSGFVAHSANHLIQQRGDSRFAVGTGDTDKCEFLARTSVPLMRQQTECLLRILDQDVSYTIFRIGEVLTIVQDNDRSTFFHAGRNERVSVNCSTCLCYKQISSFDLA